MGRTVLKRVIDGIADAEGTSPATLDLAIQRYVSTKAIRALVAHDSNAWRLQFETPSHVVVVTGNDEILVDGQKYG